MNSSSPAPKLLTRSQPYFGQWHLCLRGYQAEMHCLRELNHARIDNIMTARREWGRKIQLRQPGSWYWAALDITPEDVDNLHSMCDFLLADQRPRKLVISGSWFYLYTNDPTLVEHMSRLPWLDASRLTVTQIEIKGQPGTVMLKQPRWRKRSYFRSMILDDARRSSLARVLGQQQSIRLGPSLAQWIQHPKWSRTLDHHFIDHDDDAILTLLGLVEPRLIRRTLPIVENK